MPRILIFIGIFGFLGIAGAATTNDPGYPSYDPETVFKERFELYFKSLKLDYEPPLGCSTRTADGSPKYEKPPVCALAADFNGDGSPDYAALMEYIGGDPRSGERYIDLVILFSSQKDGGARINILTHLGKVDGRGDINTFLSLQPAGEIRLPSGVRPLPVPAINVLRGDRDNDDPWSYPTFTWHERLQKFYALTKATD